MVDYEGVKIQDKTAATFELVLNACMLHRACRQLKNERQNNTHNKDSQWRLRFCPSFHRAGNSCPICATE
jgi:hypothetical protein